MPLPRSVMREDFPLRQFIQCAECGKHLTGGIVKKKFPYLWCYNKACKAVFVPNQRLELEFRRLLGMFEPAMEYLDKMAVISASRFEVEQEQLKQTSRSLSIRLAEQKQLNAQAIAAKVQGEISDEDFEALKASLSEQITEIEKSLLMVESKKKRLSDVKNQKSLKDVRFVQIWDGATLQGKVNLQKALFPAGLYYDPKKGYLNSRNQAVMDDIYQCIQSLGNTPQEMKAFLVKFGRPGRN